MVDEFIQWLSAQNWKVIPAETATPIPEDVLSRYGHAIPQSWLNFAGKLAKCEDQTGNKWFLVGPDFKPAKTEDDWSWNELELMGLDAARKLAREMEHEAGAALQILAAKGCFEDMALRLLAGAAAFVTNRKY